MPFVDMIAELRGTVPRLPLPFSKTLVNRAYQDVRNKSLWSFLLVEGQWITPTLINTGTVSVVQGANTVVLSPAAAAALNADTQFFAPITTRQFRVLPGAIYNITDWDGVDQLTLDRAYGEATNLAATGYLIYKIYYAAPVADWKAFLSVRNLVNVVDLGTTLTREEVDQIDPQRLSFSFPTEVVPYKMDLISTSPTYGYMLYELWPAPQYSINHQLVGLRRGTALAKPTDTLPYVLDEQLVIERAKVWAYEWAEANKDANVPRTSLPDYKFLMGKAQSEFDKKMREARRIDRELVDNFFTTAKLSGMAGKLYPQYSSIAGTAFPGRVF